MQFKKIINKFNYLKEWFALLGVVGQLSVVIAFGVAVVILSGIIVGSVESSYTIFVDPAALFVDREKPFVLFFSFLLMLFGLVVTGFIISVLSSSLENTFRDIRKGRLKYFGQEHTLIINYNHKILNILKEINLLYEDNKSVHDIVIFINNDEDIEKLQIQIKKLNLNHVHIYIRYGDVFSLQRYAELSFCNVYSIIVLSDATQEDSFIRDNINLRIVNILFSCDKFVKYLKQKKKAHKQVKAVVEFSDILYFENIVAKSTESLFLALAPTKVLSSILDLSMINIDFYNTWSQLLSFENYELYFVEASKYNVNNLTYKELLLRQKNGLLIGISRDIDGSLELLLNAHDETIKDKDWLLFISRDIHKIDFLDKAEDYRARLSIKQPLETFTRDIVIIGDKRNIRPNELLDIDKSKVIHIEMKMHDLFERKSFEDLLQKDSIIVNLDDETLYRVALNLKFMFNQDEIRKFVFLVDDALIADHLQKAGFKNTILSQLFVSKYIAQVSNQLSLHKVFNILFVKEGPEINFLDPIDLPSNLVELKHELIHNKMLYLGIIRDDDSVIFEAKEIEDARKIIVFCNGEE